MPTTFKIPVPIRAVVLVVTFAIGMGGIGYGVNDALNAADRQQEVSFERCQAGNELREGLYGEKMEELEEVKSHGVKYYETFLGHDTEAIKKLRRESIEKIEERLVRYAPDNCEEATK